MELSSLPSNLKRTNIYKPPALGSHLINFRGYRLFGKNPKQQKLSLLAKVCTRSFKVKVKKLCLIHYWFSFDTNVFFCSEWFADLQFLPGRGIILIQVVYSYELLTYNSCGPEETYCKLMVLLSFPYAFGAAAQFTIFMRRNPSPETEKTSPLSLCEQWKKTWLVWVGTYGIILWLYYPVI